MPTIETLDSPMVEFNADHPSISLSDVRSPSNYTYYPWTLPLELIPYNATSSPMAMRTTFDLSFPNMPNGLQASALQRIQDGILVNSMSGLRLGMVREQDKRPDTGQHIELDDEHFRVYAISNIALGRDEKVFMSRATMDNFNPLDPFFTRTRDANMLELVVDVPSHAPTASSALSDLLYDALGELGNLSDPASIEIDPEALENEPSYLSNLLSSLQALLAAPAPTLRPSGSDGLTATSQKHFRHSIAGALPLGPGAAPLPDTSDPKASYSEDDTLAWSAIYIHPNTLCEEKLVIDFPRAYQVIVIPRGGCSFSTKLRNIAAYPPGSTSLQLVIIVSYPEHEGAHGGEVDGGAGQSQNPRPLVQPLLDEVQFTPSGLPRPNPIPLIMVNGGEETMALLRRASGVGLRRKYYFTSQGVKIDNLIVL